MQRRIIKRLGVLAGGFVLAGGLAAAPALAGGGPVNGEVDVSETLTLTLSANTFDITNVTPGTIANTGTNSSAGLWNSDQGNSSPFATQATVATNDSKGYTLAEALTSQNAASKYGFSTSDGTNTLMASGINQWGYLPGTYDATANPGGFGTGSFNNTTGAAVGGVAISTTAASGPSGDSFPLAWEFNVPANQVTGSYTGAISLTLLGK